MVCVCVLVLHTRFGPRLTVCVAAANEELDQTLVCHNGELHTIAIPREPIALAEFPPRTVLHSLGCATCPGTLLQFCAEERQKGKEREREREGGAGRQDCDNDGSVVVLGIVCKLVSLAFPDDDMLTLLSSPLGQSTCRAVLPSFIFRVHQLHLLRRALAAHCASLPPLCA